jgi:hypothetical protein
VSGIPWGDLIVYAAGPLVGAAAAALLYETITGLERVAPAPRPGAATPAEEPVLVIEAAEEAPGRPPPPAPPPSA